MLLEHLRDGLLEQKYFSPSHLLKLLSVSMWKQKYIMSSRLFCFMYFCPPAGNIMFPRVQSLISAFLCSIVEQLWSSGNTSNIDYGASSNLVVISSNISTMNSLCIDSSRNVVNVHRFHWKRKKSIIQSVAELIFFSGFVQCFMISVIVSSLIIHSYYVKS